MPVSRPEDLPAGGDGRWPLCASGFRSAQWGDMEIGYTTTGVGDHAQVYQGLPGGVCQCPHYGYVFKGVIRSRYPGTDWPDEVASAGESYFFPAGHILSYEEETEALELNPAAALNTLMDHIESLARKYVETGQDASSLHAGEP